MSSADRFKGLNASSPTDENLQEEREMILSTLSGLDEITEDFKEKFSNVDREIVSIHRELKELKKDLEKKFKDLRD